MSSDHLDHLVQLCRLRQGLAQRIQSRRVRFMSARISGLLSGFSGQSAYDDSHHEQCDERNRVPIIGDRKGSLWWDEENIEDDCAHECGGNSRATPPTERDDDNHQQIQHRQIRRCYARLVPEAGDGNEPGKPERDQVGKPLRSGFQDPVL